MKYNAFLSYSHAADNALAPSLQSALHRLARPWNRLRALRVFRDKTSLAASPELWPAIVAALSEAEYFLLLASPTAAASRWVQREIDWWLEHRSASKLLVLLTDGQLAWDEAANDFDWQRTDALAPGLRGKFGAEPLWVDLRWARSGETLSLHHSAFRAAVLDIAAPLHGRSKDELDGEDVRQLARTRRFSTSAVAGLVLLTVISLTAAFIAVQQRDEAQRQRDEARRQTTTAQAGRLAAQANLLLERDGPVDDGAILAMRAAHLLDSIGTRSFETDLVLRRALALLPRTLSSFETLSEDDPQLALDGRYIAVKGLGDQPSVRDVASGGARGWERERINKQAAALGLPGMLIVATTVNGSHCATVPLDHPSEPLELWSTGPLVHLASVPRTSENNQHFALSDDAQFLAITDYGPSNDGSGGNFSIWSRARGAEILREPAAQLIRFGPGNRWLAASNGVWRMPDRETPNAVRVVEWARPPWSVAFSRSGELVSARWDSEQPIEVWDLTSGKSRRSIDAPQGELLAIADAGTRVALSGAATIVWDADDQIERARLPMPAHSATFSEHELLALADDTKRLGHAGSTLFAMTENGAALASHDYSAGHVHWIGFSGEQLSLLVAIGDTLRVETWSWQSAATPATRSTQPDGAWAVSANGERFAIANEAGIAIGAIGQTDTQQLAMPSAPSILALSAQGDVLATVASDRIRAWRPGTGAQWSSPPFPGIVTALRVSADGRDATAIVWDGEAASRAGKAYRSLRWRVFEAREPVSAELGRSLDPPELGCDLGPCGLITAAGRYAVLDGGVEVKDDKSQTLARLEHPSRAVLATFSRDGRLLATVDEVDTVRVWALDTKDLIAQSCARKPRALDPEAWVRYMPPYTNADALSFALCHSQAR